jgi:lysozyme
MMEINEAGVDLIKQFEGCVLQSYRDLRGIWTIGYGHTGPKLLKEWYLLKIKQMLNF